MQLSDSFLFIRVVKEVRKFILYSFTCSSFLCFSLLSHEDHWFACTCTRLYSTVMHTIFRRVDADYYTNNTLGNIKIIKP